MLDRIRNCKTVVEWHKLLDENKEVLDTFNYGEQGIFYKSVGSILDLDFPEPYRTSYSCTMGPTHHFPSLDADCRELFTYGANGRPTVDARCRPMPEMVYGIGVEAWKISLPYLSAMC